MIIEKYKYLGNSKYKVIIDKKEYLIYEDIIIKNNLLAKENLTKKQLDSYLESNKFYEAYYLALDYIKRKLRTFKELEKYLIKKEISNDLVMKVIEKLEKEGYLNQNIYVKAYINDEINLKMTGPNKIKNDLINLGIRKEIIDDNIIIFTDEIEIEKIKKYITKESNLNKNKSFKALKQKILNNLLEKGFNKELILNCLNDISVNDEEIYEREYQKLYDKLSKKYTGKELEYKIKQKLYQKGFANKF